MRHFRDRDIDTNWMDVGARDDQDKKCLLIDITITTVVTIVLKETGKL